MPRARFITLEGGEGAGKSTQVRLLAARLEAAGHRVTMTREPGGAPGAEAIRQLLVTGDVARWTPKAETLLHFAAREDHLAQTIRPALGRGEWVICDRFVDSTVAYQGAAQGLGREFINELKNMVVGDDMPALTLILDLPVAAGLARAGKRGETGEDRYERMDLRFHETLRQAFADIAKNEPGRCLIVDAAGSETEVSEAIWAAVQNRLQV